MEAALDFSPPIIHESERYEFVRKIGSGGFGEARLMRDKLSGESVAIKYLERGDKIDEKVQREIINHRSLRHPNIIAFKEVILTATHLAIVMEYAPGGELFERIRKAGKLCEDEARFFFQQLISGVSYCHKMEICHRDLKLENLLLDGNPIPRLQICDFGYSKSSVFNSLPRSTVGTPAYIAPEVLQKKEYDGKVADVWSCGVTLYVMLFGTYPFVDPENPNNIYQMFQRILTLAYSIPKDANLSRECLHLISRIFVLDAKERITIPEIKKHEWYLKNLPEELRAENEMEEKQPLGGQYSDHEPMQSNETIIQIVEEASIPDPNFADAPAMDLEMGTDSDEDDDDWLVDSSGELVTITSMQRGI